MNIYENFVFMLKYEFIFFLLLFSDIRPSRYSCVVYNITSNKFSPIDCEEEVSTKLFSPTCETDIDECIDTPCEDICQNTEGSYNCKCPQNQFLDAITKNCTNLCRTNLGPEWIVADGKCVKFSIYPMLLSAAKEYCSKDGYQYEPMSNQPKYWNLNPSDCDESNQSICSEKRYTACSNGYINDTNRRGLVDQDFWSGTFGSIRYDFNIEVEKGKFIKLFVINLENIFGECFGFLEYVDKTKTMTIKQKQCSNLQTYNYLSLGNKLSISYNFMFYFTTRRRLGSLQYMYESVNCGLGMECPESSNCGSKSWYKNFGTVDISYRRPVSELSKLVFCIWKFKVAPGKYIKVSPNTIKIKSGSCTNHLDFYEGSKLKTIWRKVRVCDDEMSSFISNSNRLTVVLTLRVKME